MRKFSESIIGVCFYGEKNPIYLLLSIKFGLFFLSYCVLFLIIFITSIINVLFGLLSVAYFCEINDLHSLLKAFELNYNSHSILAQV